MQTRQCAAPQAAFERLLPRRQPLFEFQEILGRIGQAAFEIMRQRTILLSVGDEQVHAFAVRVAADEGHVADAQ